MFLAVDIGNSAIKFGLFEGETLTSKFSIPTKRDATADEIKLAVGDRLNGRVEFAMVCSVVSEIDAAARSFLRDAAGSEPISVNNSFDFGLKITYEPLDSLGTDRLVAAYAAVEKYGVPCIVCSLGTATTIDVVNEQREFLGGVIAPGIEAMAEALHMKAPRLPKIETEKPDRLIGNSTMQSIRSGVFNGYVAMVEGLIERMRNEVGGRPTLIATGGNAGLLPDARVDENLILDGLASLSRT